MSVLRPNPLNYSFDGGVLNLLFSHIVDCHPTAINEHVDASDYFAAKAKNAASMQVVPLGKCTAFKAVRVPTLNKGFYEIGHA